MKKFSRDLKLLLAFSALRNVTDLFLGTFLVSFIMQLSVNEIVSVSAYRLFEYVATCAGFFLFAKWCKRYDKVAVFALNQIPKIALLGAIIFLGNRVVDYVIPLGVLYGIGASMYHLPMNLMVGEKVDSKIMGYFVGTRTAINYTVRTIAPVLLGVFIDVGSFIEVSYVILALAMLEFILSFFLTASRHRTRKPLDFGGFFRCMFRFAVIRKMFLMEVLRGFGLGLLTSVITMYTVYMFKTDLNLGIFTTVFAVMSIIASYSLGRLSDKHFYRYVMIGCLITILICMAVFVWNTNPVTFLIYNTMYATAISLLDQFCAVQMLNVSKSKCVTANHKIEYFVFRDFALFLGRWAGFVGLMYIGVFAGYDALRYYLIPITLAVVLAGVFALQMSARVRMRVR